MSLMIFKELIMNGQHHQIRNAKGVYKKHFNGYYTFVLHDGDIIIFEQINHKILREFDLKSEEYIDKVFEIGYTEIYDDFESDDFLIFRLEHLSLLFK